MVHARMHRWAWIVCASISVAAADTKGACGVETGFLDRSYEDAAGERHQYVVFVPAAYDPEKPWPLIVFLHGAGERGTDNREQVSVGLGPVVRRQLDTFPALVLFPQARKDWLAMRPDLTRAIAELDRVEEEFNVAADRVYVTGLSMGGRGTWDMVHMCPDRFAAAVPICGFFNDELAPFIDLPTWFFHGDADPVVSVGNSRKAVRALRAAGGNPRYTEFADVGHDSWLPAYDTPELIPWMLSQSR